MDKALVEAFPCLCSCITNQSRRSPLYMPFDEMELVPILILFAF